METLTKVEMSSREARMPAAAIRLLDVSDWISHYASGSLRKAYGLGFSWRPLYLEERVAYEFGWGFHLAPRSRVTFGDAIMEGDCKPLTEACWHANRIFSRNPFPDSDRYELKYIIVAYDSQTEGVGVVLRETSAPWIPKGHIVYSIIAEWSEGGWKPAENPL